jgi:exosome complex component RRP40
MFSGARALPVDGDDDAAAAAADAAAADAFREVVVLPGDDVTALVAFAPPPLRLGAGLFVSGVRVRASRAGVLAFIAPARFFVLSSTTRYAAAVGDAVVGIVRERAGADGYRVRLGGAALGALPALAFDGATRRNKPALGPGAVVFARVATCSKHVEPELSCAAPPGAPRRDWTTGEALYGELRGGALAAVPLGAARRLLDPSCALFAALGRALAFQAAVGLNGLVWVRAADDAATSAVVRAIERAAAMGADDAQCAAIAEEEVAAAAAHAAGGRGGSADE